MSRAVCVDRSREAVYYNDGIDESHAIAADAGMPDTGGLILQDFK